MRLYLSEVHYSFYLSCYKSTGLKLKILKNYIWIFIVVRNYRRLQFINLMFITSNAHNNNLNPQAINDYSRK